MELIRLIHKNTLRIIQLVLVCVTGLAVLAGLEAVLVSSGSLPPHGGIRPSQVTTHRLSEIHQATAAYYEQHQVPLPEENWQDVLRPYMSESSKNTFSDGWGHPIQSNGDGTFTSPGPDGQLGTGDDWGRPLPNHP